MEDKMWRPENDCSEDDDEMDTVDGKGADTWIPLIQPDRGQRGRNRRPWLSHQSEKRRHMCLLVVMFVFLLMAMVTMVIAIVRMMEDHDACDHVSTGADTLARKPAAPVGCSRLSVQDVWTATFPQLLTESAIRLLHVNGDGVLDVVTGFGTGADGYHIPAVVCDLYFNGSFPCFGGLLALDGATGHELWRSFADHEIFGVNCNEDISGDGVKDCLAGGRSGAFQAVSGRDGRVLWKFGPQEAKVDMMNLYTAQFVPDRDGDGVPDVLAAHGGDPLREPGSLYRLSGRLLILSGKDGKVLRWAEVPDRRETYYSPQVYTRQDGRLTVLFGTGGETHPGSLWRISLDDLYEGNMDKAEVLYSDSQKGVMTPPVLVDLTADGTVDIVMAMFNSTVVAMDGETGETLWDASFPMSESYRQIMETYPYFFYLSQYASCRFQYNDDDVPDFMVHYQHGPGFPIYYQSHTTILDGRNGQPLVVPYIRDTVGAQASPLAISVEGHGNDVFLYWVADCTGYEGESGEFDFVKGTNVHEQSRADFCKVRFKTSGYSQLAMMSGNTAPPGVTIYDSRDRFHLEHDQTANTTAMALRYIQQHPEVRGQYQEWLGESDAEGTDKRETESVRGKRGTTQNEKSGKRRPRRHVGPHDEGGVQRLLSTDQYYGFDHDAYEHVVEEKCASARLNGTLDSATYQSQTNYNPFNVHMGAMTIYRVKIRCGCTEEENDQCSRVLPYSEQGWAGYMGTYGTSHYVPRT
uniref:FAM234A/B beta-propeller domain-containing protein n=1 Tax=Branchiostoma floridae TaxID=7739 RepID=C3YLU4_BRAFL|eukprot:XP_002602526.1 hypothetical protein BRAFLDRAFT_93831 [Branchiostoma floridae]